MCDHAPNSPRWGRRGEKQYQAGVPYCFNIGTGGRAELSRRIGFGRVQVAMGGSKKTRGSGPVSNVGGGFIWPHLGPDDVELAHSC